LQVETLLLRQVHPSFVQEGRFSSQAFVPTKKDEGKLSVYHGGLMQPEPAWKHYTTELQKESVGVIAVTVAECDAEQLPSEHDCALFPEHCFIDFRDPGLSKSAIKKKAESLATHARSRGWLFQAP
jgi:hypothetical protein